MIFSEDILKKTEEYAANFFSFKETAILVCIDISDFMNEVTDVNTDLYKSYHRGRLISENEIRKEIISTAKMGSPAAQQEALKLISKLELKQITDA